MISINLPKLLYIGDVSVSNTVAGEILLYKLLQTYPKDRLQIVESNTLSIASTSETRLPGIVYHKFQQGNLRLLHTRFAGIYSSFLHLFAHQRWQQIKPIIDTFNPERILTVLHGFSWLTAALVAKKYDIPLHVIIHDDWASANHMPKLFQQKVSRDFEAVYQQAVQRYCISPYMEELYRSRYGVEGTVLYCSRGYKSPEFDTPPSRVSNDARGVTIAYAGSLHLQGYIDSLIKLAEILQKVGGQLLIYSSLTESTARNVGLMKQNVVLKSLIPSTHIVETLRNEADILYTPMSFEERYSTNMQIAFPSKLAEYTATGLPLLIWGPANCSAVRWAKENPGVAEIVDTPNMDSLDPVIKRLVLDPNYRFRMGKKALEVGKQYFSHVAVSEKFFTNLAHSEVIY